MFQKNISNQKYEMFTQEILKLEKMDFLNKDEDENIT